MKNSSWSIATLIAIVLCLGQSIDCVHEPNFVTHDELKAAEPHVRKNNVRKLYMSHPVKQRILKKKQEYPVSYKAEPEVEPVFITYQDVLNYQISKNKVPSTTSQTYVTTPQTYTTTTRTYITAPQPYRTTPQTYRTTPQTYRTTPQTYRTTPQTYRTTPQTYRTTPQTYRTTPQTYRTTPQTYMTTSTAAYLTPVYEETTQMPFRKKKVNTYNNRARPYQANYNMPTNSAPYPIDMYNQQFYQETTTTARPYYMETTTTEYYPETTTADYYPETTTTDFYTETTTTDYYPETTTTDYYPETTTTDYYPETTTTDYYPETITTNYYPETSSKFYLQTTTAYYNTDNVYQQESKDLSFLSYEDIVRYQAAKMKNNNKPKSYKRMKPTNYQKIYDGPVYIRQNENYQINQEQAYQGSNQMQYVPQNVNYRVLSNVREGTNYPATTTTTTVPTTTTATTTTTTTTITTPSANTTKSAKQKKSKKLIKNQSKYERARMGQ